MKTARGDSDRDRDSEGESDSEDDSESDSKDVFTASKEALLAATSV